MENPNQNLDKEYQITLENASYGKLVLYDAPEGIEKAGYSYSRDKKYWGMFKKYAINELGFVKKGKGFIEDVLGVNKDDFEQKITITIEKFNFSTYLYEEDFKGEIQLVDLKRKLTTLTAPVADISFEQAIINREKQNVILDKLKTIDGFDLPSFTREKQFITLPEREDFFNSSYHADTGFVYDSERLEENKPRPIKLNLDSLEDDSAHSSDGLEDTGVLGSIYTNNATFDKKIITSGYVEYIDTVREVANNTLNVTIYDESNDTELSTIIIPLNTEVLSETTDNRGITYFETKYFGNFEELSVMSPDTYLTFGILRGITLAGESFFRNGICELLLRSQDKTIPAQNVQSFLKFEAFARVIQHITNKPNPFRSNILGRTDSEPTVYNYDGDASKACVTNGKLIRGFNIDESPLSASLKDLFTSENAINAVGMGVETENGEKVLRLEEIPYFFDTRVALTLDNVSDIEEDFDKDLIWNSVKIGYQKGESDEIREGIFDYNSKTEWSNPIKTIDKTLNLIAPYSASNASINEARQIDKKTNPTKDSKYDEINYMIDLVRSEVGNFVTNGDFEAGTTNWEIGNNTSVVSLLGSKRAKLDWTAGQNQTICRQFISVTDSPTISFSYAVIDEGENLYTPEFEIRAQVSNGDFYRLNSEGKWVAEFNEVGVVDKTIRGVKAVNLQKFETFELSAVEQLPDIQNLNVSFDTDFIQRTGNTASYIIDDIYVSNSVKFKARTNEGFESIEGIVNNDQSYNINWSPANSFRRWGFALRAFLENQLNQIYTFAKSDKNSKMITKKVGENEVAEDANILINDLDTPLWRPNKVSFKSPITDQQKRDLQGNFNDGKPRMYGLVKFIGEDMKESAHIWIDKLDIDGKEIKCTGRLISKYIEVAVEAIAVDDDLVNFTDDDGEEFIID